MTAGGYEYGGPEHERAQIKAWIYGSSAQTFTVSSQGLPEIRERATGLVTADKKSLIVVAGSAGRVIRSKDIIRITCRATECNAVHLQQKLQIGRIYPLVMLFPDYMSNCR